MKIINVCGARPNFMKIAALAQAFKQRPAIETLLVHTGQHYDERMSRLFFDELEIPTPDINLEVGSGSHAAQTAEIMKRFETVCLTHNPTHVLVVGDVNSTIACALVAAKLGIKVIHVEAGLRSFDSTMPEEINRVLTDRISDLLFVSEESGVVNLQREGVAPDRVHFVGNVMIDTLIKHRGK
ncbi:MAG: UDP-N-acetyl glucosamine 2-epimerase, partial [Limisphaerales bacterium]